MDEIRRGHVIGGTERFGDETIAVIDPATASPIGSVPAGTETDVDSAVTAARETVPAWDETLPAERGRAMHAASRAIRDRADELAELLVAENGKSRSNADSEVETTARYFEYYAGIADKLHGDSIPLGTGYTDFTVREPLGVTAHVVPWNFPVMLFGRTVAPSLAAGNATVVKPAEQTPLTATLLTEILDEQFPDGLVNVVHGDGPSAGAPLAGHEGVDGVAFTGSVPTGQAVAKQAVQNFNPVHVEAGGKNPNVVFPDADIDATLDSTLTSIFRFNAGQVCSAGDRLLLHEDCDEFLDSLVSAVADLTVGPGATDPDVAPIVSRAQFDRVREYIEIGRAEAGEPIVGGDALDREGYFVEPTIFDDVPRDARIAHEEIFGPVVTVFRFADEREAIELANDTQYGLVAGIHTSDVGRALRFAKAVDAGQIYVNEWFAGGVETPFGGYGMSGFGREKGLEALDNFTQTKNVCLNVER